MHPTAHAVGCRKEIVKDAERPADVVSDLVEAIDIRPLAHR